MRKDQFFKLIEYIDAAIADANAGPNGLHESVAKISIRQELYDSFFKEENEQESQSLEETSDILCKMPGETLPDAARRVMRSRGEHFDFFNRLLNPDDLGWAVSEEVRDEARAFLGIPKVKKKK